MEGGLYLLIILVTAEHLLYNTTLQSTVSLSKEETYYFLLSAAGSPTATLLRLHPGHQPYFHFDYRSLDKINSHGVTGGVYKTRERIHRGMLIRDY